MKKLEIVTRPEKLDVVKKILAKFQYSGMTVTAAMGCGQQKGLQKEFAELNLDINLLPKIYIMTVVYDEDAEAIVEEILEKVPTGMVGDGKIFISEIEDVIRVRTGERGKKTL